MTRPSGDTRLAEHPDVSRMLASRTRSSQAESGPHPSSARAVPEAAARSSVVVQNRVRMQTPFYEMGVDHTFIAKNIPREHNNSAARPNPRREDQGLARPHRPWELGN